MLIAFNVVHPLKQFADNNQMEREQKHNSSLNGGDAAGDKNDRVKKDTRNVEVRLANYSVPDFLKLSQIFNYWCVKL